jgi:hypothetical protein
MTAALDAALAYHLGMVVHDCAAAMERYGRLLRVPRWHTVATESLSIAFGRGAGLTFELIQPLTEGTLWADYLQRQGEGVQHLGFWVPDVQAAVAEAVAAGAVVTLAVLQDGGGAVTVAAGESTPELVRRINPGRMSYLDIGAGGVQFEFVGPASYDRLRELVRDDLATFMALPAWTAS